MIKIATLGEGVTSAAVQKKVQELDGYEWVDIGQADLIVTSPGVPPRDFPKTNIPIISEIEFAYRLFHRPTSTFCPRLIGITGTNGKTTVTSMIAYILNIPAAGNIGVPLISFVDSPIHYPWIALELSSYQLECCTTFHPEIAVWLNLTDDHLERHKTLEEYARQKAKIFQNHTPKDGIIYPENDKIIEPFVNQSPGVHLPYSETHPDFKRLCDIQLMGKHNQLNALAAFLAVRQTGMPVQTIVEKMNTFPPVEHRIELVSTIQGRSFYNDSKGTNPSSTQIAVDAFDKPIHLIICGKDKGLPLESFIQYLHQNVKTITLFGEMADRFTQVSVALNPTFPLHRVNTVNAAIAKTFELSSPDEVILFSPSSSSFDQFKNFEERGKIFKELVHQFSAD